MKKPVSIFLGIAAGAIIIVGGLFAGRIFYTQSLSNAAQTSPEIALSKQQAPEPAPNPHIYDASPPSRGAHINTLPVTFSVQNENTIATLSGEQTSDVQAGQNILLYKNDGTLLKILGQVEGVEKPPGTDDVKIAIKIKVDNDHPASDAVRGEIIIKKESSAQRLPLSSIVKGENGDEYIWEILKNDDGTLHVEKKPAVILGRTYDYVVIDQPDSVSNVYILNPDESLADNQKISTRPMLYSAPSATPDMIVMQDINARTRQIAGDPYRGPIIDVPCEQPDANSATATDGAPQSGQGCGANTNALDDFIQKMRNSNAGSEPLSP